MGCNYSLQINTFENGQVSTQSFSINEDNNLPDNLDIKQITELVYKLSTTERKKLANLLRQSRAVPVTNKMITNHNFVSNTSLEELGQRYSDIYNAYPDIDTTESMVLISCDKMKLNGSTYYGRCLQADGKPIFFINGQYGVKKLFEYLDLKGKIEKAIKDNQLSEDLKEFDTDLAVLSEHYKKSAKAMLLEYLDNKATYSKVIKTTSGASVNPTRTFEAVFNKLRGKYDSNQDKSDLQISIRQASDSSYKDRYGYKITMKKLYGVLQQYVDNLISYDEFNSLSQDELQDYLHNVFIQDAALYKLRIDSITGGKKGEKEVKAKTQSITQKAIKEAYSDYMDVLKSQGTTPTPLDTLLKDSPEIAIGFVRSALNNKTTLYTNLEVTIEQDKKGNNKIKATYTTEPTTKETEGTKYIIFKSPYSSLGEVYDFGYSSQYLFSPVNSDGIENGNYHGAYIYAYYNNKTGVTHYAISRSIINPNSYAATYNNLERAKYQIDKWNSEQKINEDGLYSIKMNNRTLKRTSKIEATKVKEGQILTTLNLTLPDISVSSLPPTLQNLIKGTVPNFQQYFNMIQGIETLETPEKAAAFIFKFFDVLRHDAKNLTLEECITKNKNAGDLIVKEINEAPTISYFIEKLGTVATLRYLNNNGNDVQVTGKFNDGANGDSPTTTDMTNAISYINDKFGINIHSITQSELNSMKNVNKNARAFILNGQIYINTSNAKLSDLYHEMAHIMMGILKVKYPDAYQSVINQLSKGNLKVTFNKYYQAALNTYKNYARQDVIEEAVANTIASNLYNKQYLVEQFKGQDFLNDFIDIFNNFPKEVESPDFGLDFSTWLKTNYKETSKDIKQNMKMTNLVSKLMQNRTVIESCD